MSDNNNEPTLHLGMHSGALFEFTGEAAHKAHQSVMAGIIGGGFVEVCRRAGFCQYINLQHVETIDWYPNGCNVEASDA